MSPWRAAWEVARWEFARFVKLRQQVMGLLLTLVFAGIGFGAATLALGGDRPTADVVVIGGEHLPLPAETDGGRARLATGAAADAQQHRAAVGSGDLDGLLILHSRDEAELLVRERGRWVGELEAALTAARQQRAMEDAALTPEALGAVLAPVRLELVYHQRGRAPRPEGTGFGFAIAVGIMVLGIFTGMGYIFASITGEKQQRVTEQVVSAISPQSWIDGKILGLAGVCLVSVLNMALGFGLITLALRFTGRTIAMPASLGDPGLLLLMLVFAMFGFLFWLAFLGAVAAVIEDQHNSSRGQLLFLPILAAAASFFAIANPDGGFVRTLGLLPPTSATMMPARLLVVEVPAWEVMAALVLLVAATFGLRRVAGRVFELGMLMYGKEPSWAEIRHWMRAPR